MKLNPDCIRAILLCAESSESPGGDFIFLFSDPTGFMDGYSIDSPDIAVNRYPALSEFTEDEIRYHLKQCADSGLLLLDSPTCSDVVKVNDLTPAGHKFLADIREDSIWKETKSVMKKTGAASLSAITQIASNIIATVIQNQFNLIK